MPLLVFLFAVEPPDPIPFHEKDWNREARTVNSRVKSFGLSVSRRVNSRVNPLLGVKGAAYRLGVGGDGFEKKAVGGRRPPTAEGKHPGEKG